MEDGNCVGWITVMEKAETDLREKLKDGKMNLAERQKAAIEVKEGYEYLKKVGIYHHDLKPENVLMKNGEAKWTDFGMIREQSGRKSYRKMGYAREGSKYKDVDNLCKLCFDFLVHEI